jgi:hypothetical protein
VWFGRARPEAQIEREEVLLVLTMLGDIRADGEESWRSCGTKMAKRKPTPEEVAEREASLERLRYLRAYVAELEVELRERRKRQARRPRLLRWLPR